MYFYCTTTDHRITYKHSKFKSNVVLLHMYVWLNLHTRTHTRAHTYVYIRIYLGFLSASKGCTGVRKAWWNERTCTLINTIVFTHGHLSLSAYSWCTHTLLLINKPVVSCQPLWSHNDIHCCAYT